MVFTGRERKRRGDRDQLGALINKGSVELGKAEVIADREPNISQLSLCDDELIPSADAV